MERKIFISHHSTAIDGSSLTKEESRLLIVYGTTAKGLNIKNETN